MSLSVNNKLVFQCLVENIKKDYLICLNQEFDNSVLNLVKQNGFYPYEYIDSSKTIEKSKERLLSKDKFYSSLIGKGISMKMFLNTETNLE